MTESDAAPTCYRHTDRETYVRCTRCDRSICPDCMNAASVGFQCPECVREGNKSVRQARTVFGGHVVAEAYMTKMLLGINIVAFVAQLANDKVTADYLMLPAAVAFEGEYYRMMSSAFLHSPNLLLHIAFNMYALFAFGSQIERLLGPVRYVALYVVSALGGAVVTYAFADPFQRSLGASGAVFGLFGAYFVLARSMKADTSQIVLLIGINLAFGFVAAGYINNYAHVGGLVAGAAVAFAYAQGKRHARRDVIHVAGVLAVVAALVAATVVRTPGLKDQVLRRSAASSAAAVSPEVPRR